MFIAQRHICNVACGRQPKAYGPPDDSAKEMLKIESSPAPVFTFHSSITKLHPLHHIMISSLDGFEHRCYPPKWYGVMRKDQFDTTSIEKPISICSTPSQLPLIVNVS